MTDVDYNKVLKGDFSELRNLTDIVRAIHTVYEISQGRIPREAINDALYRLSCSPEDMDYAKQQLRYMVRWLNN